MLNVKDDKLSPAKVFTANNTPSFVNSFENLPMPTEDFVRNYGRRMHHIAYEVKDGDYQGGEKNIDFVVDTLKSYGLPFLANVEGVLFAVKTLAGESLSSLTFGCLLTLVDEF
jgi:hypothetical protein